MKYKTKSGERIGAKEFGKRFKEGISNITPTQKLGNDMRATFITFVGYCPSKVGVFFLEGAAHSPSNPYSASKSGEEAISRAFAYSFGMPITITNTMNVFGERQHPEKFVPMVIQDIVNKKKVTIHGTDKDNVSSRCWIHAREVANALLY